MTGPVEAYQLSVEAAEVYEARFVPALFAEWAPHLVEAAGLTVSGTRTRVGPVRFGSADEAVATELDATPLGAHLDPDTRRRVLEDGVAAMGQFVVDGGRVELPIRDHLVTAVASG